MRPVPHAFVATTAPETREALWKGELSRLDQDRRLTIGAEWRTGTAQQAGVPAALGRV